MSTKRKRVVVLGGGVGAMTAACYLAPHHDVSVYQLGWRLGGKGASGRNVHPGYGKRIEEHGLHIWMGFYQNAFRLMREVYGALDRPPDAPLRNVEEAFKPHDVVSMMEKVGTPPRWIGPWQVRFDRNDQLPGTAHAQPPRIRHLVRMVEWLAEEVADALICHTDPQEVDDTRKYPFLRDVQLALERIADAIGNSPLEPLFDALILDNARVVQALLQIVTRHHLDTLERDDRFRHLVYGIDLGMAILTGFIRSRLLTEPWESIDHLDFHDWLSENGLTPFSRWCPPLRSIYELCFGFDRGIPDERHANMAAGSTLRGVMWIAFGYSGAVMYKMQGGMGDTVFAPIYQLLSGHSRDRHDDKVPFYFFHRVLEVVPSADGRTIERIRIGIQAKPKKGPAGYEPLIDVKGLGCWPSEPRWDELEDGDALRESGVDFESMDSPVLEELELVAGKDFDHVVFGLSIGSIPSTCGRLLEQKPAWQAMVEQVKTVRTQAFQLWLHETPRELGWPPAVADPGCERAVLGTFIEPIDTWADMSQLIPREEWAPDQNVRGISYFCGPLPDWNQNPAISLQAVIVTAQQFVDGGISALWHNAQEGPAGGFPWDWLVDPAGGVGVDRFYRQYFRANTEGSELYVRSAKGSTQYRLRPAGTGYDNLTIAGDWTRTRLNVGCVEAAVMSGIEAVQPLVEDLHVIDEEGGAQLGSD